MSAKSLKVVLQTVQQIALEVAAPRAAEVDQLGLWPQHTLRAMQSAGLGGLVVPVAQGGLGLGMRALAEVSELLGRACASSALCFGMHCVGAAVLGAKATADQQHRFLEPIAAGTHLTTLALSEPGTGIHFYLPESRLTEAGTRYRLDGRKSFVTNGGQADSYVVSTVASGGSRGPGEFSCVVVEEQTPGLTWEAPWLGAGMRGNSARGVRLDQAEIPRTNLLGSEGDEIWYVFNVVAPYFLMAMSGTYLGIAGAAFEEAKAHLTTRRYSHSGALLSDAAVLQHRLGTMYGVHQRTRLMVHHAATLGDTDAANALPALCTAKAEVADSVVLLVNEALTLVGGKGYSEAASPLMRHLRDARAAHVMSPTTDLLRTWTGRALLGVPLLGE